ncbi:DUF1289 domain-containing protein [Brevundimonas faecalis]|uniref:Fe-S protein YdhL (DUF1289 family) n=1 Tax=Brevundimonas faecalis TaxID=947378 RepID=A0ABV2R7R5_9CAUL
MSQPTAPASRPIPRPVATPCVMVCTVDGASGLCLGCFRTLKEIATWSRMSEDERAEIMQGLSDRRSQIDPALLGE